MPWLLLFPLASPGLGFLRIQRFCGELALHQLRTHLHPRVATRPRWPRAPPAAHRSATRSAAQTRAPHPTDSAPAATRAAITGQGFSTKLSLTFAETQPPSSDSSGDAGALRDEVICPRASLPSNSKAASSTAAATQLPAIVLLTQRPA